MIDSKDRKPTRRTGIRMLGIGGAWAALELGGSRRLAAAAATKATAFALYSDVHHPGDYIKIALTTSLVEEAESPSTLLPTRRNSAPSDSTGTRCSLSTVTGGFLAPAEARAPQGRLCQRPRAYPKSPQSNPPSASWISAAQGKAVKDFVEAGGAALFYHNTTHISLFNADFRAVHGGAYKGHPQLRPSRW
jgi:hypothetical protein